MHITLMIIGCMEQYFTQRAFTVELADGAVLLDLMPHFEQRLQPEIAQPYWNFTRHCFRGPVLVMLDSTALWDMQTPLRHGQTLHVKRLLTGG